MRTERRRMVFLGLLAIGAGVWGGCADAVNYDELHKYCSEEWKPDLGGKPADLSVVGPPKCAAAKGLSGDAIVCVDFDKLNGLTDPALTGWDFTTNCGAGWQIAGGKLQVKNFGSFVATFIATKVGKNTLSKAEKDGKSPIAWAEEKIAAADANGKALMQPVLDMLKSKAQ